MLSGGMVGLFLGGVGKKLEIYTNPPPCCAEKNADGEHGRNHGRMR